MQLINPNGTSNGFVKSFIHEQNNAKYYGARYYDPEGNFIKEDLFLSRVVSVRCSRLFVNFLTYPFLVGCMLTVSRE